MVKKIICIVLLIIIIVSGISVAQDIYKVLKVDNNYVTPCYIVSSEQPGPIICITGGIHGDEPAGYMAAKKVTNYLPSRGKILIIPYVNMSGILKNCRLLDNGRDLNRCFPGNKTGDRADKLAAQLNLFIINEKVDLVVDMHESKQYAKLDKDYLGQTLIAGDKGETILIGLKAVNKFNSKLQTDNNEFSLYSFPVKGSLTWAVSNNLDIPAFTIETCKKLPLQRRIKMQIEMVKSILTEIGVEMR